MKNFIVRHSHLFAGLGATLLLIAWVSGVRAQTVEQVQAEVDATQVDLATVDAKATDAKGRANSLELRVTNAEGTLATHGAEVSAVATGQATLEQRVATLEAAPPPPPSNQAQVDSNSTRILALEADTGSNATPMWTIRDSAGVLVGAWADRAAVGRGVVETAYGAIPFHVTPTSFHWELDDSDIRWTTSTCSMLPSKIGVPVAIARDTETFDGEGTQGLIMNGDAYLVNWSLVDDAIVFRSWIANHQPGTNPCQANPDGEPDTGQYYPLVLAAPNPMYLPPFTLGQEVL